MKSGYGRNQNTRWRHLLQTGAGEPDEIRHIAAFKTSFREHALSSAISRMEKAQEFAAQHGPVRILFKDGKPVEQRSPDGGADADTRSQAKGSS